MPRGLAWMAKASGKDKKGEVIGPDHLFDVNDIRKKGI